MFFIFAFDILTWFGAIQETFDAVESFNKTKTTEEIIDIVAKEFNVEKETIILALAIKGVI